MLAAATWRPLKRTSSSPSCRHPLRAHMLFSLILNQLMITHKAFNIKMSIFAFDCDSRFKHMPGYLDVAGLVLVKRLQQLHANVRFVNGPLNVYLQHALLLYSVLEHCRRVCQCMSLPGVTQLTVTFTRGHTMRLSRVKLALVLVTFTAVFTIKEIDIRM